MTENVETPEFGVSSTLPTQGTLDGFLRASLVWVNKPHVVNRRLCGSKLMLQQSVVDSNEVWNVVKRFQCSKEEVPYHSENSKGCQEVELDSLNVDKFMVVRDLLPKSPERHSRIREIVLFDRCKCTVSFYPVFCETPVNKIQNANQSGTQTSPYQFKFIPDKDGGCIQLQVPKLPSLDEHKTGLSIEWIEKQLLPKLVRWSEEKDLKTSVTSLRLVPVDDYGQLYDQLKQKHGPWLVENWTEKTDPQKFVYEDIAIATYLLLIWKEERERNCVSEKQTFVDLGCGNGLLVYILSAEGHHGLGLDVRKRKIWDLFESVANLQECSITPSAQSLFPEYDWILGNHSDELTPWIPVITARSRYSCSYFVLPCCHHDFDRKFSHKQSGSSQYHTYLEFVRQVGQVCGFSVEQDTLRIPSTKRVCFIGRGRTYPQSEEQAQDEKRCTYIAERCRVPGISHLPKQISDSIEADSNSTHSVPEIIGQSFNTTKLSGDHVTTKTSMICDKNMSCSTSQDTVVNKKQKLQEDVKLEPCDKWSDQFEPRSNIETTRNCQKVERHVRDKIIQIVFDRLLAMESSDTRLLSSGKEWRKGGALPLCDAVGLFDREVLLKLKAECGGLQTLLKNQSSVFKVLGGVVRVKDPFEETAQLRRPKRLKTDASDYYKTAPCWFYQHHPDGCPKSSTDCTFAHGENELQERPLNKNVK